MTETSLLFLTFLSKNFTLDPGIKKVISRNILNMINWLYSTSGYYDKTVKGSYFDFDVTAMNQNFFQFIKHLEISVQGCEITQFFIHEGFILDLFNMYREDFIKKYNIHNLNILNGTEFSDRIGSIFEKIKGKRLLVISSFDGLIQQQYNSGNLKKIYENFPDLESLETIKSPYCFCNDGPHNNYFETLESLMGEIMDKNFDIALLGCGVYGHMLTHKIHDEFKKDAIYVGGSIATLFGIIGQREKQHGKIKYDQNWISEIPEEYKPSNYKLIEQGCYW